MENAVLFVVLAPFDNEQSDLINRVHLEAQEVDTAIYRYRAKKVMPQFRSDRDHWKCLFTLKLFIFCLLLAIC